MRRLYQEARQHHRLGFTGRAVVAANGAEYPAEMEGMWP